MEATYSKIKIEFNIDELKELRNQLAQIIDDLSNEEYQNNAAPNTEYIEAIIRERYPKVNELLNILSVRTELPF